MAFYTETLARLSPDTCTVQKAQPYIRFDGLMGQALIAGYGMPNGP